MFVYARVEAELTIGGRQDCCRGDVLIVTSCASHRHQNFGANYLLRDRHDVARGRGGGFSERRHDEEPPPSDGSRAHAVAPRPVTGTCPREHATSSACHGRCGFHHGTGAWRVRRERKAYAPPPRGAAAEQYSERWLCCGCASFWGTAGAGVCVAVVAAAAG